MLLTSFMSTLGLAAVAMAKPIFERGRIETILQLDQNMTQFENLVTRRDGTILATRLDVPQVWLIDPKNGKHEVIHIPAPVIGVFGITEYLPDLYAINVGNITGRVPAKGSFEVWEIDLLGKKSKTRRITRIPEAGLLNGIATLNPLTVLTADAQPGRLLQVDVLTGKYKPYFADAALAIPAGSPSPAGINGVRVSNGFVYFANSARGNFNRFKLNNRGQPTGAVHVIASNLTVDDFAVLPDGTAFLVSGGQNTVNKVTLDGKVTVVAGSAFSLEVGGGTSAQFGKTWEERDILFVTTGGDRLSPINGTLSEPAKVVSIDLAEPRSYW